jgi:hypothetical protein
MFHDNCESDRVFIALGRPWQGFVMFYPRRLLHNSAQRTLKKIYEAAGLMKISCMKYIYIPATAAHY